MSDRKQASWDELSRMARGRFPIRSEQEEEMRAFALARTLERDNCEHEEAEAAAGSVVRHWD